MTSATFIFYSFFAACLILRPNAPVTSPSGPPVTSPPDAPVVLPPDAPVVLPPDTPVKKMVDLGYHHLFISRTGSSASSLTVLFESGAGGTSRDWDRVRALLPAGVQTIAYDRAGSGKSEAGPLPRTMAQEVYELHELLTREKIDGPIILVGQSIGGLLARLYTEQYGKKVVGLVLVDPTHESGILGSLRYGGLVRLREKAVGKVIPHPQLQQKESPGYDSTADYMAEEFQKIYLESQKKYQPLRDRPLIVLGAGRRSQPPGISDEKWKELQTERDEQVRGLTLLSGNSKFILVPQSGHMIHYDNPAIVADAIRQVIGAVTSKSRL